MRRRDRRVPQSMIGAVSAGVFIVAAGLPAADPFPEPRDTEKSTARPMPPDEVCGTARLPPGFELQVFAAEPAVANPIGIATDARGRLWVAENYSWSGAGFGGWTTDFRDRVVVFADRDGDGRHDERTVFWDGARRLTSIAVGLGGAWVLDLPRLLFIPDRDGDLVPDGPPEVVLDGFDEDAVGHTPANGLKWGPDGWLYGRHGIQATSRIGRPGDGPSQRVAVNTGVWRYHPGRRCVEGVLHGMTNSWGFDFDARGEMFVINTVIGHLWHVVPGSHVERMYGVDLEPHLHDLIPQVADHVHWDTGEKWSDVRGGISDRTSAAGGGHAHIGLLIEQGDNWPAAFRDRVYTLNLHGRRINSDHLTPSGAGFTASHGPDLAFFADPFFRGMDLVTGADGAVFIADWSDTGECHDHDGVHRTSGRIYRLAHGRPAATPTVDMTAADSAGLRRALFAANQWWSRAAVREWQRRSLDGASLDADADWLTATFATDPDPLHRLRCLWALAAIDRLPEALLARAVSADDPAIRAWGVRLLGEHWSPDGAQPSSDALDLLVRVARSERSSPVPLHLASLLPRLDAGRRFRLATALASHDTFAADPALPRLVWYGIAPLVPLDADRAVALARTSRLPSLRRSIARRLADAVETTPEDVTALLTMALEAEPAVMADVCRGLADGLRGWSRAPAPAGWSEIGPRLAAGGGVAAADAVRELDVVFGTGRGADALKVIALDGSADPAARRQAIATLVAGTPADGATWLVPLLGDRAVVGAVLVALARYDDPTIPGKALERLGMLAPAERAQLVDLLAARRESAAVLLAAVAEGKLRREEISAHHARQIAGFADDALTRRLVDTWGEVRSSPADRRRRIEQLAATLDPATLAAADRGQGRAVFARACGSCHVLFGSGRLLGPDLTGSNRRNLDYLLENVVDPGASVAAGFRAETFVLEDGRAITGVVSAAGDRTLTVRTAQDEVVLDKRTIAERNVSATSLMPDNLLVPLSEKEIRDLIAYVSGADQVPLPPTP
ncbi:MAG: PVC-type heme-binding CxxCH protein [Pirellulales bacterium]